MEENKKRKEISEDDRFRYIGFDIYPGKAKEFWKSEEEKKAYLERIKKKKGILSLLQRDHSAVHVSIFSPVDRIVLTASSVVVILSIFFPWFSFHRDGDSFSYSGLGYLFNFSKAISYASSFLGILSAFFMLLMIISSVFVAIYTLLSLYKKLDPEEKYYSSLKSALSLNYIPLAFWILILIFCIFGFPTSSAGGLGVKELKQSFNFITFMSVTSVGMWIAIAGLIVNCVKVTDL